jgi:tRNA(Arg) A34 adenosine deaminase TadA
MPPDNPKDDAPSTRDFEFLRRTFQLALEAKGNGKHPFGALVVDARGAVISEAGNNSLPPEGDPTQHAEVVAAAKAARLRTPAELASATLYASAEPCCMCAGAIYWCNIGRVVYALSEERLLGITGDHPQNPTLALTCRRVFASGQHPVKVVGPLIEDEASEVHRGFWGRIG